MMKKRPDKTEQADEKLNWDLDAKSGEKKASMPSHLIDRLISGKPHKVSWKEAKLLAKRHVTGMKRETVQEVENKKTQETWARIDKAREMDR